MEGDRVQESARRPLSDDAGDVAPDFVAAAFAQIDAALSELLQLRSGALSGGEVRAVARGIAAREAVLQSAGLRVLAAMDARDDVVPRGLPGKASLAFQTQALRLSPFVAKREAVTAHLVDADTGDLPCIGAAYAEGLIRRGHVDIAVRTHRELGATLREEVIPFEGVGGDDQPPSAPRWVRRITAFDAWITQWSLHLSVREVDALARAFVRALLSKQPSGATNSDSCTCPRTSTATGPGASPAGRPRAR